MTPEEAFEESKRVNRLLSDAWDVVTYLVNREELDSQEFLMRIHLWRTPIDTALRAVNSLIVDNMVLKAQNQELLKRLAEK